MSGSSPHAALKEDLQMMRVYREKEVTQLLSDARFLLDENKKLKAANAELRAALVKTTEELYKAKHHPVDRIPDGV